MKKMVEFLKSFAMSYGVDYVIEYMEKNKDELILEILGIIDSSNYYSPAGSVDYLKKN